MRAVCKNQKAGASGCKQDQQLGVLLDNKDGSVVTDG